MQSMLLFCLVNLPSLAIRCKILICIDSHHVNVGIYRRLPIISSNAVLTQEASKKFFTIMFFISLIFTFQKFEHSPSNSSWIIFGFGKGWQFIFHLFSPTASFCSIQNPFVQEILLVVF